MFDYIFKNDETIILYDQNSKILMNNKLIDCCVMITSENLILFKNVNQEEEHSEILRITKGINNLPKYGPFLIKKLNDINKISPDSDFVELCFIDGETILISKSPVTDEIKIRTRL